MKKQYLLIVIAAGIFFQNCNSSNSEPVTGTDLHAEKYVCLPCGQPCDDIGYTKPGSCKDCSMELVRMSSIIFKSVLPKNLYAHISQAGKDNVLLLDVRTPEEFNGAAPDKFGRLKNAVNIPVQQLAERIKELEPYKSKEIIVYCSHSHRSPAASYLLTQKGFLYVTNMQYGMHLWKQQVTDKESNDSLYVSQQ
ncbi:MAG: rhodanese-like domain-containing protein [Chitinophagaceae bacterium]|nr:rhodanese-like domain-containing protein [Chitinophagaceae bacterium]